MDDLPIPKPDAPIAIHALEDGVTGGQLQPIVASTLADRCYAQLKEAIVTLELRPGTPLSELHIASQFGISKSPVREAFQRLSRDGLVSLEPNRRCRVTGLDTSSVRDWYDMRLILEPASLLRVQHLIQQTTLDEIRRFNHLAIESCNRLDPLGFIHNSDLFHLTLVGLNPNQALVDVVYDLFNKIRRVRIALYQQDQLKRQPSFTREGLARHESIIQLLATGMGNEAVTTLARDIQTFIEHLDNGRVDDALDRVKFRKTDLSRISLGGEGGGRY